MNGFADRGLDEDKFGEKGNIVSAFDAFRKFSLMCFYALRFGRFMPFAVSHVLSAAIELFVQATHLLTGPLCSEIQAAICHENIRRWKMDGRDAYCLCAAHNVGVRALVAGL